MKLKQSFIYICFILLLPFNHISLNAQEDTSSPPTIYAESAIVMDADTGDIYYKKNMNRSMYPASITKLMTALLTLDAFQPEDIITFSDNAINSLGYGSSIGIRVGEQLTYDQAVHGLLLMSSNEAANALAEAKSETIETFVDAMNKKAEALGANHTHFTNPHGLYDVNHTTTAYDMALITKALLPNAYFLSIMQDSMYEIPPTNKCDESRYLAQQHKMLNTKKDLSIYRDDVIAGKVGYTSESGHTLVTVSDNGNRRLIVVVMKSNYTHVYDDTALLIDYGYTATALPITAHKGLTNTDTFDAYLADDTSADTTATNPDIDNNTRDLEETKDKKGVSPLFFILIIFLTLFAGFYIYRLEQRRKRRLEQKRRRYRNLR